MSGLQTIVCNCVRSLIATLLLSKLGDSEIDQLFRIYRSLGTPDEEIWPGISKLPEFKPIFPIWKENILESLVETMEASGVDLLRVS